MPGEGASAIPGRTRARPPRCRRGVSLPPMGYNDEPGPRRRGAGAFGVAAAVRRAAGSEPGGRPSEPVRQRRKRTR
jgi:hypothetical protein